MELVPVTCWAFAEMNEAMIPAFTLSGSYQVFYHPNIYVATVLTDFLGMRSATTYFRAFKVTTLKLPVQILTADQAAYQYKSELKSMISRLHTIPAHLVVVMTLV